MAHQYRNIGYRQEIERRELDQLSRLQPEDLAPNPRALGAPVLRPYIAYERVDWYPTVGDNSTTRLVPRYTDGAMPTQVFDRVTTNDGLPIPHPPAILGPGSTDITRPMPPAVGDERPTALLPVPPGRHRA